MKVLQLIYEYAVNACSILNTQPWSVKICSKDEFVVKADLSKLLTNIDHTGKELFISVGAFIEALYLSGLAMGRYMEISYNPFPLPDFDVASVKIFDVEPSNTHILKLITSRQTVRDGYDSREFSDADQEMLKAGFKELAYYSMSGSIAQEIASLVENSFIKNINNTEYLESMARWVTIGETIPSEGINISYKRSKNILSMFKKQEELTVFSPKIKKMMIDNVQKQVREGAGWLCISTKNDTHIDWLVVGRIFYRMAVAASAENIGMHPMTSVLESSYEYNSLMNITKGRFPQLLIRAGFYDESPFNKTTGRRKIIIHEKTS